MNNEFLLNSGSLNSAVSPQFTNKSQKSEPYYASWNVKIKNLRVSKIGGNMPQVISL